MADQIQGLSIGLNLDTVEMERGLKGLKEKMKTVNTEMAANMSAFDRAERSVEKYETQLTGLNRKLELQERATASARTEYEKMVEQYGEGSKKAEKAAQEYNTQAASLNNLERYIGGVSHELQNLQEEQRVTNSGWTAFGRGLDTAGGKLTNIGGTMTSTVTPALAGMALGFGAVANAADSSSTKIQRTLGLTEEQAKELSKTSRELWEEGMGEGIEDVDRAILQVRQNMKGLSEKELKQVTKDAIYLGETFDADVNEVTRAGQGIMKGFGTTSSEAFDLMAWGAQNGLNFSNEMFDNLSEYAPLFGKMGFSAQDYFQLLEKGSSAGVYNLDYINDSMKELQIRLKDGSKGTADAMDLLSGSTQQVWKDFNSGKGTVKDVHNAVIAELKGMDDQVKANNIGVGLYGTKWEDLEAEAMYAMGEIDGGLENLDGAMSRSGDAVEKTFSERAQMAFREFQTSLLPLGETLLDLADTVLPPLTSGIEWLSDKFNDMTPAMREGVIIFGGMVAVAGPLALAFGGIASAIAPILPMIAGAGGIGASLLALANPIGITIGALAGLGIGFALLDNEMDKPIEKSDIFKGKISDATKEAYGSYLTLSQDANAEMELMFKSQGDSTDVFAQALVGKYAEMGDKVLTQMKLNHDKEKEQLGLFFAESGVMTEEQEAIAMQNLEEAHQKEIEDYQAKNARIMELLNIQATNERDLTAVEKAELRNLSNQADNEALKALVTSQDEQAVIKKNMKDQSVALATEEVAANIKKAIEWKDKSIENANTIYKEKIATIDGMNLEELDITTAQVAEMKRQAEDERDGVVNSANGMYAETVIAAENRKGANIDAINLETGGVLGGYDQMYNGVLTAINWIRDLFGKDEFTKKGKIGGTNIQNGAIQGALPAIKWMTPFANGTPNGKYASGVSIVSEEGRELIHEPGKGTYLSGDNGPEIRNLQPGTSVLPNQETEKLLKNYGFPGYADGIGDFFDSFLKGTDNVWSMLTDKFKLSDSMIPSWLNKHTGSPLSFIGDMAKGWIKDLVGDMGSVGPSGKGVSGWRNVILQAAVAMRESITDAEINGILAQIQRESGGNEKIVQSSSVVDINTLSGNPARGLLQYIPQTFSSYMVPGHGNINSGYDQLLAFFNNKTWRRDLPYGKRGWGPRGGRKFETGGLINSPGLYELAEGGWPEFVIPTDPSKRTDAMKLLALAGKEIEGNKRPNQLPSVSVGTDNGTLNKLLNATIEQTNILLALLGKDQTINMDGREVAVVMSPYLEDINTRNTMRSRRFGGEALG